MKERQSLQDFTSKINSLFGLEKQGRELVAFVTKAIGCKYACLLFLDIDEEDFSVLSCLPKSKANPFHSLRLNRQNPIVNSLKREKKLLTREGLTALPDFKRPLKRNSGKSNLGNIELLAPVISRNRLIGILVLGERRSGKYSPEDYSLLQSVTDRITVSLEKEYLREQFSQQKEELAVINRSSAIMASSLDIQRIFDSFINELRKIVDIDWAAITLITEGELCLIALSSKIGSAWKVGEQMRAGETATEWVAKHKKSIVEPDLMEKNRFVTAESHIKQGVRSVAYLPLIAEDRAIGSLIVASRQPNAYSQRQIGILEELVAQITMPIEHSQLYAQIAEKARIDGLTGLFNRRSLDEALASEISRHSRYGGVFSLIILDIDSLKTINDQHGHLAGDEALRQISSVIRNAVRTSDQAFRYGGDEFAVLLPNTSLDAAAVVAERIRKQIASEMIASETPVTASLGLASWPANGKEVNEVIAAADAALYQAKMAGGNKSQRAPNQ